ncbi:MAG TPA: NapC/NirT family cytochrome c [Candidatus Acidoferrum sp.]|jgi:nitrate/TMAO reductase-like tetraheme cytochrome c subunit
MHSVDKRPIWYLLTLHWVSLAGSAIVITAIFSFLFVLPLQMRGHVDNPYIGIIVFLILPAIFIVGLLLIPIGIYLGKRRLQSDLSSAEFDRKTTFRRLAWFFGITTLINIIIGTQLTYRAVEHMETPQFCGQSCHSMSPEFAAYQNSPHARVACVECHVVPGAAGWIASKRAGTRQLVETIFNTYRRPVPGALESNRLVPATQTCENCHWPEEFGSARLRVVTNYAEDEKNTRTQTVLMMMVGGSKFAGIHGKHFGPGIQIRFAAADAQRQGIPWVEYRNNNTGTVRTFVTEGSKPDSHKNLPVYEMQCVDCHNRPTHTFELPERGMNTALALGELSSTLPFVKKKGVDLLKTSYSSQKEAGEKLPTALADFYRQNYPEVSSARSQDIQQAGQSILAIYSRNVFPELKVKWGTYPNNLGHTDFPGCFRCHDGSHVEASGATITQDCSACHELIATDDASPEILKTLGLEERISNVQKK